MNFRSVGWPEAMMVLIASAVVIFAIWLPLTLRRTNPGRLGTGLLLALFFGPFGQLYVRGAAVYVVLMVAVYYLSDRFAPQNIYHLPIAAAISALVMYLRLRAAHRRTEGV